MVLTYNKSYIEYLDFIKNYSIICVKKRDQLPSTLLFFFFFLGGGSIRLFPEGSLRL